MVMRQVLSMALIGLAIGVPAAWATAHVVESFLFGIKAKDPLALSLAPAILLMAALVAGYAPAWRASRIDPWKALREE
jgi:ABC-type antimicrobial peptide transport system permease subunit